MSPEVPTASGAAAADSGHGRRFVILWVVLSLIATPLVAIFLGPVIPPGNGSLQAAGQVLDNTVLISTVTPVCVFVLLFLVYVLTQFRARPGIAEDGPHDRGGNGLQILWVIGTVATVLGLAVFGTYELVVDGAGGGQGPSAAFPPSDHAKAMDVQVIGQQWAFTYRYPSYGGVETPHLVLPAHTLIRLHVTSLDVVHSFWAYQLGVKADANPGTDNVVYVQLRSPQSFQIRCAELCGLWHGYMFDTGQVVSDSQFASWIAQQSAFYKPVEKYLPPYATTYLPEPVRRAG